MDAEEFHIREIKKSFDWVFYDHAKLNDFILQKNGLDVKLEDLCNMAKDNKCGPNDLTTVWLLRFIRAMRDEIDEMEASLSWKWWRQDKSDLENVRVELIDLFHFMLSAASASGMTGSDFIEIYYRKRQLNIDRQNVGFVKGDNEQRGIGKIDESGNRQQVAKGTTEESRS